MVEAPALSQADPLWSRDCRAYVVQAGIDEACRERLEAVQASLAPVQDGLLVCPPSSLHVSIAVLLSVRRDYGVPKDALWDEWGPRWCEELRRLTAELAPFEVAFNEVRVDGAAVIALADPVPAVDALRRCAAGLQRRAGLVSYQPSIVHCTLLRYAASGVALSGLARAATGLCLRARTSVARLTVARELVYPSLVTDAVARFELGGGRRRR